MAGLRVIRGPDWKFGNQDGGDGHVGTVEGCVSEMVRVIWDNGYQEFYRVSADGASDLTLLDNGPAGVKHPGVQCDACEEEDIQGLRWTCMDCNNYNLCTECYGNGKHDKDHAFKRIDKPGKDGVTVGKRSASKKTHAKGIYVGATVVRGPDWDDGNQDGGVGNTGVVLEIGYASNPTQDIALCTVVWQNDSEHYVYRLGCGGNVEVKYTTPATGWSYYRKHLPVLRDTSEVSNTSQAGIAGLRVVRGPSWKSGNQDGGNGHVGTVELCVADQMSVIWDGGDNGLYGVGGEGASELALLDNGPAGVKHPGVQCDVCKEKDIRGLRWKCLDCNKYDLCTECYGNDKHDTNHTFKRIDKPGKDGVTVGKRSSEEKTRARGIYPGATVVRGPDWNKDNQDGGDGNHGVVLKVGYASVSIRDLALCTVVWQNDSKHYTYRLGIGGNVDVKCTTPATGWSYYISHLPVLHDVSEVCSQSTVSLPGVSGIEGTLAALLAGLRSNSDEENTKDNKTISSFKIGDQLILIKSVSTTKELQTDHGGWNKYMEHLINKKTAGTLKEIDSDGDIRVDFGSDVVFLLNPDVCEKVRHKDSNADVKTPLDNIGPQSSRSDQSSINAADSKNIYQEVNTPLDNVDPELSRSEQSSLNAADSENLDNAYSDGDVSQSSNEGRFSAGDQVRIDVDENTMTSLQEEHGGWKPNMKEVMMVAGKVQEVLPSGDIKVQYDNELFVINPAALSLVNVELGSHLNNETHSQADEKK